jgi:hypothetical protein
MRRSVSGDDVYVLVAGNNAGSNVLLHHPRSQERGDLSVFRMHEPGDVDDWLFMSRPSSDPHSDTGASSHPHYHQCFRSLYSLCGYELGY